MKLLRLTSEDKTGLFDNDFSTSEIEIKKGDKLALQSASFSNIENVINISDFNRKVKFQMENIDENTTIEILLKEGQYSNLNLDDLFDDFEVKMNNAVGIDSPLSFGCEAVARRGTDEKVEIGYLRSQLANYSYYIDNDFMDENLVDYTDGTDKIAKETGQLDSIDDEAKFIQTRELGPGAKVVRVRICDFVDNSSGIEDNGLTFGISDRFIGPDEQNLTDDQKTFYIKFVRSGTAYKYKVKGGTEQTSTVNPQNVAATSNDNDYLEIAISDGRIEGRVYKSNPNSTHLLFSEPFVRTNNSEQETLGFSPFITFQGSENSVKAQHYRAHSQTFEVEDDLTNNLLNTVVNFGSNDPPDGGRGEGGVVILTLHNNISNYFGFNSEVTSKTFKKEPQLNLVITGERIFTDTTSNASFILELRNIKIDSFNQGQRQNILACMPQIANREHEIVEYEPNNLYFVDVSQDFNLRNIQARLLSIDGFPVLLRGLSVLTLLLKSKDE